MCGMATAGIPPWRGMAPRDGRACKEARAMVNQLLGGLFGGQDNDDDQTRRMQAQDFVNRYEQGAPWDNISGDEALHNYHNVSQRLSPQEYEESAAEAFQRMSPQERAQFAQLLQQQGGVQFGGGNYDDPRQLAQMTSQYRQQNEGGLGALFGGSGGGGGLGSMLGGALGGSGGGSGGGGMDDMLNNPLAKAALGGIAAMAMRKMMR